MVLKHIVDLLCPNQSLEIKLLNACVKINLKPQIPNAEMEYDKMNISLQYLFMLIYDA